MKPRATLGAAFAAALLCLAGPARADQEAILLDYSVSSGCPDRKEFVARVHTFTTKARVVTDATDATDVNGGASRRRFGVLVARAGNAVRGELTIDDHGAKTTRHVSGATCDEVISALALATAIAVDPDALGGTPPAEPAPTAPTEPTPKPAVAPATAPTARSIQPKPAALPKLPAPPALYLSAGARVGDAMAPFPKLELTSELGCTYFAPFEFYVGVALGPEQHDQQFRVEEWLGWLGVGYRIVELEPFSVLALAAAEGGSVHAGGGPAVTPTRDLHRPWFAVDVGLAARHDGPGPLFFQANVGARAPVLLQRYVETESNGSLKQLHQVGQLGYLVGLSVGIHFL